MITNFSTPVFAANGTVSYIASISELVPLTGRNFNLRDQDDNRVLETAVVGNCNYLVTGDKDLLSLKQYEYVHIVTPTDFLDIVGK